MKMFAEKEVWITYRNWAFWVGLVFFAVYPTCNWLTSIRGGVLELYWMQELTLPFVPELIWIYLSMYVLFLMPPFFMRRPALVKLGKSLIVGTLLSGLVFLCFPARLGFLRIIPSEGVYQTLFAAMFSLDKPHNLLPSLHVVFSSLIIFGLIDAANASVLRFFWLTWLLLICIATVLVHQHHILDVFTGLLLAVILQRMIKLGDRHV